VTHDAEIEILATGLQFPEGPVALADGSVLVVEIASGALIRVDPDGSTTTIAECGGGPNGAALGPDGALYVCNNGGQDFTRNGDRLFNSLVNQPANYTGGSIQRVELATGNVTTLYVECDGEALSAPNDIVFDVTGGFWFTDSGKTRARDRSWGGVYYAQPDGSSIAEVIHPLDSPNGVGLSPEGNRLYVADTTTGRVWWWEVLEPGVVDVDRATGRGRHLRGAPAGAPFYDSLAVEADGGLCVGTLFNGGITMFRPDESVEFIPFPDRMVTNICFGGFDHTTAYVTLSSSGALARTRWPRPGLPLAFEQR
jgi:gluconolactonase